MNDSCLLGRIALTVLLLAASAVHAIHLGDPNRAQLRVLDACLAAAALVVSAWVLSNRGDSRRAASGGFATALVTKAVVAKSRLPWQHTTASTKC